MSKRLIDYKKLDRIINSIGIILFFVFISIHVSHYVMMHWHVSAMTNVLILTSCLLFVL
jgi:hypothetical protein